MKRFQYITAITALFSGLIVASRFVSIWITLPIGLAYSAFIYMRKRRELKRKIEEIQHRLGRLRSEGLFIEDRVGGMEDDIFYGMILTLLTDLERSLYKLVEKNIQLLSLKEIGRNIISSLDEKKLIESVFDYLIRGVGYKETAFILLRKKKGQFQAFISIEKANHVIRRVLNFGLSDLNGACYRSFLSGRPFLIKDVAMHPLMRAGKETFFPESTMTSYLCVPLVKSVEEIRCLEAEECALKKMGKGNNENSRSGYLTTDECLACNHIPLLGALIITDGYRATPLTNIDQVTLETVGSLVSSNIENWMLYQELRLEELFRENVIEGMINGVFAVDLNGGVTLANRTAREMSMFGQEEVTGVQIQQLIVEARDGSSADESVSRVLAERRPLAYCEAYLRRKDGLHIPIRMNIAPLYSDEDEETEGAIIEFLDISELKRMEEEIRHLDRLAVLGRFTSSVAHEIRNPLTGIAAGIQYLNRDKNLSKDQRENISFILNEVDRLNRIITDLFKVAKPRKLLYQNVEIASLVERGHKSNIELFNDKRIDFKMEFEDNLPMIEVDPDQIVQVMINLMKNSAEAVDEGGKVWVRVRLYRGDDLDVILEKDREMVCVEITDNGPGIEPADRERIFEPFFSRKKGGTGLGLFVTHSIIQHHQGKITLSSVPSDGTSFKVYLPISMPRKGGEVEAGHSSR
jgi:PAS domain S-box-containing protein